MPTSMGSVKRGARDAEDSMARGLSHAFLKPCPLPVLCGEPAPDVYMASVEKRIRAEQACQQHELILASLSRFQDWMRAAELWTASPATSQVPFAVAKEELKKFEVLQRQIQEKLHHLESLNRQYRLLVQANSTGFQSQCLRAAVQESNEGWDNLQKRAAAILKRLKYFVDQREEFEWERETVQVQLTELDLRLTDVEHFSGGSSLEKMRQLQEFQEAVQSNADRLDRLLVSGERLIQRSEPQDAEILEEELQELSTYCQEVFRRVFRFRRRLVSMRLVFEDEWLSDRETDVESDCFTDVSPESEVEGEVGGPLLTAHISQSTPRKAACCHHLHPCRTVWGDSLDLEWDPSVDVGGSTSHDEEDSSYCSAITGVFPWEEPSWRNSRQQGKAASCPSQCGREEGHEDLNAIPFLEQMWTQLGSQHGLCRSLVTKRKVEITRTKAECSPAGQLAPPELGTGDGAYHQAETMGFDPKRIESWLGQTCMGQDKLDVTQPDERSWAAPGSEEVAIIMEKGLKSRPSDLSAQPQTGSGHFAGVKRLLLSVTGLLVLLLAWTFLLSPTETHCSRANGYSWSYHFMLKYVNGPPPT